MLKQHILVELKQFIYALSSHRGQPAKILSETLVKSSLNLLEGLPSAREVVFEYFSLVFDVSIGAYYHCKTDEIPPENEAVIAIQEAIEGLVSKGSPAWNPVIASWSLKVVGVLSSKYWPNKKMDIGAACNLWLDCGEMRFLLGIISSCFRKLSHADAEVCVGTLLDTFRKYTPTYDWVVARLGGCFPFKIITQILHCGLKKFTDDPGCRFDSEIGILDYLAYAHDKDLQQAIKDLLEDGFNPKKPVHIEIVPYLLQIAHYSEPTLQTIVNVFLEMYDDKLLELILQRTPYWMTNKAFIELQPSLNNLTLKMKANGAKILMTVAKLAETFSWCKDFLEYTLQELENVVLLKHRNICPCLLLVDLSKDDTKYFLWKSCESENLMEQQTAIRLLLLVATQYPHIYDQTIAELLSKSYRVNKNGLGALIRAIGGMGGIPEFVDIKVGLTVALERSLIKQQFNSNKNLSESTNTFQNLLTLSILEKNNSTQFLKQTPIIPKILECFPKIAEILEYSLNQKLEEMESAKNDLIKPTCDEETTDEVKCKRIKVEKMETDESELEIPFHSESLVHIIIDLLTCVGVGSKEHSMTMLEMVKLSNLSVKYFFWCLTEKCVTLRAKYVERAICLLQIQSNAKKPSRLTCIRNLVEHGLFTYGYLFGRYEELEVQEFGIRENEKLITQNRQQILDPKAYRSILHNGIIGNGARSQKVKPKGSKPNPEMQYLFLKAIDVCCMHQDKSYSDEGYSTVSLLLVELVSTDSMYNGFPFPDEEFTKITMERDILINRAFVLSPVLWSILGFLASHRPSLCFSSVLLRALCALCLHQWRAQNVNKIQSVGENAELMSCTRRLLEILTMGQLLPPPLSNLHCIIEHFEAAEIALILKECVWNYLRENCPSPAIFYVDTNGLPWRNPASIKLQPQYVDILRNIMQKKLPKLGSHYYEMFVMPILRKPSEEVETPTVNYTINNFFH